MNRIVTALFFTLTATIAHAETKSITARLPYVAPNSGAYGVFVGCTTDGRTPPVSRGEEPLPGEPGGPTSTYMVLNAGTLFEESLRLEASAEVCFAADRAVLNAFRHHRQMDIKVTLETDTAEGCRVSAEIIDAEVGPIPALSYMGSCPTPRF